MQPQVLFFVSVAFSFLAWTVVARSYIWPRLATLSTVEALRPILVLHSFRFIGLAFLVPGVVSPDLPSAFANSDAYGDIVAAALALTALALLPRFAGIAMSWVFSLWGTADLLRAFYEGNLTGLLPGQLGATYFIPTLAVPLLLVTHVMAFRLLLRRGAAVPRDATA